MGFFKKGSATKLRNPAETEPGTVFNEYGYRYYQPDLGRWASRDSIGEEGGMSLYRFSENAPSNQVDAFGLWVFPPLPNSEVPVPTPIGNIMPDGTYEPNADVFWDQAISDCQEQIAAALKQEKLAILHKQFDSECELNLRCICCDSDPRAKADSRGFYDRNTREIRMCANRSDDQLEFTRFLYEELFHALQHCGKIKTHAQSGRCERCLCNEIQAKAGAPRALGESAIATESALSCRKSCLTSGDPIAGMDAAIAKAKALFNECSKIP
ncbi:hypothetical protein HAHE_12070 [Haloferula helveola]|uniref:RHS repeat-associated core domain-containing protein n=1 Tax=Haloferula helveola TaxID=490095 RepID=A0ABM7REE5_9BACT|nr:hypothetical protein HAHE_12070 [Haloferula helveola]